MASVNQKKAFKSIIISHPGTDFDSLASMHAAYLLDRESPVVLIAGQDTNVREFLALYGNEFPRYKLKEIDISSIKKVTIVDCSSRSQLKRIEGLLDRLDVRVEMWDHHREEGPDFKANTHVFGNVGANTTLLIKELKKRGVRLSSIEATLLILGIYEDTGSLLYPSTTAEDLEAAAWLLKQGASLEIVDRFIGIKLSPPQKRLLTELGMNVRILEVQGIPIHFTQARADEFIDEIAFLARKVQEMESADVLFALVQLKDRVFVVGRSRLPSIDLGQILGTFGGGGHSQAASALVADTSIHIVLQRLIDVIRDMVSPSTVARDIMTSPVKTISPDADIKTAGQTLARLGISGLVVTGSEQNILGIITRKEVDKATGHNLGHAPVKGYMIKNPSVVDADAPLPEIQKIVIENHSGFIPVLSDGKLSGVITRSDLIDAIHSSFRYRSNEPDVIRKTPEEKGQELLSRIPESYSALLGIACELADSMNVGCYLVGGIVRDLVMGGKNSDIDLLIEGEGLLFAHALANTLDARVIENKRFQTGKVVLADGIHIDVATAREEIYPQPGALPEVEAAGIMDDLSRRDFTINTLAIQLNSRHWGRLIDHFGAVRDIEEKKIRVLHTFSFVEDPTRVMRALRFSARYGFEIDNDTRDLLIRALLEGRLDDVSHERIRDEILLCIREPEPWKIIRRLWDEGVFGVLDPGLTIPAGIRSDKDIVGEAYEWISRYLPEEELPDRDIVYIGFLLSETIPDDAHRFVNNYSFDGRVIRMADSFPEFATVREAISDANIKPSVLTENIEELTSALWANLVVGKPDDSPEKINVARYLAEYRNVQPEITGTDLISEGFAPGKSFGLALEKVRKAKLDGLIGSIEDEMRIVKETLHSV